MTTIGGIFHINLNCRDLNRSRDFYELLGFRGVIEFPEGEYEEVGRGLGIGRHRVKGVLMRLGNHEPSTLLDLLEWIEPREEKPCRTPVYGRGIPRIALWTTDIAREFNRLKEAGIDFVTDPLRVIGPTGLPGTFVCFRDPDGNLLELIEVAS